MNIYPGNKMRAFRYATAKDIAYLKARDPLTCTLPAIGMAGYQCQMPTASHAKLNQRNKKRPRGSIPESGTLVELEGIEPSSKQGHPALSTRLSQPKVFERWLDLGHLPAPYPLKVSPRVRGHPRLVPMLLRRRFGEFQDSASGRRLVPAPCAGIKLRDLLCFDQAARA